MTESDIDAILLTLADDAFVVMNWARKQGLKRDMQLAQVVFALKKTLADKKVKITSAAT